MQIISFSVKNYRSITKTKELPLHNLSILIGPNNEGKSNLLRALILTLNHMKDTGAYFRKKPTKLSNAGNSFLRKQYYSSHTYDFQRDYPYNLPKNADSASTFSITVHFTDEEKNQFTKVVGKKIKGDLKIEISLAVDHHSISIVDTKNSRSNIIEKSDIVLKFISDSFQISYIPAIRDSDKTIETINNMISSELEVLQHDPEYDELMKKISEKQKPILDSLALTLTGSVKNFLTQVEGIRLDSREGIRRTSFLSTEVFVNDGNETPLEMKGDGIKSLMAISIIQHVAKQQANLKSIILAIEEPESHLHPEAIHKLKDVLEDISQTSQVIISTHSPLMVDRTNISKNLIVHHSQVKAAQNISEVRKILGVKIADNLHNASLIILTEGEDDIAIIKSWISDVSTTLIEAIKKGIIVFDSMNGSSNVSHKISYWKNSLCRVCTILDHDGAGMASFKKASEQNLLTEKDVIFLKAKGFQDSEIEDLILPSVYKNEILNQYRVNLDTPVFRNSKSKWSKRMEKVFEAHGKLWNPATENNVKNIVSKNASLLGIKSVHSVNRKTIKSIIQSIEYYFKSDLDKENIQS